MEYPGSHANTGRSSVNDGRTVVHRDMLAGDAHPMCLKNTLSGASVLLSDELISS